MKKGVDGFRVDAIRHMYESADFSQDEPRSFEPGTTPVSSSVARICLKVRFAST